MSILHPRLMALLAAIALAGAGPAFGQNLLEGGPDESWGVIHAGGHKVASQFQGNNVIPAAANQAGQFIMPGAMPGGYWGPEVVEAGPAIGGYPPTGGGAPAGPRLPLYFRAEALLWDRDQSERVDFSSAGVGGSIVLSSDDIDFTYEAVSRFALGLPIGHGFGVEAVYFGLQEWEESAAVTSGTDNLFSAYSDFGVDPPLGFAEPDAARFHAITYDSQLHNAELNLIHRGIAMESSEFWVMMGFRYLKVEERLDFRTLGPTASSLTTVDTDNDLVGYQMGFGYERCCWCGLRVNVEGKAGMYVNMDETETRIISSLGGVFKDGLEDDNIALVGESAITGAYDLGQFVSLRFGYHMLFVDGVALAPENFNPVAPSTGTRRERLDDSGSILYHGPKAGIELHW